MNIAFIPVRGGSKSIKLKNIKNICGKPLVYWVLEASNNSSVIDKVVVATDHIDIKKTVLSFNFNKVEIYDRDPKNAQDTSPTMDVILEYINNSNISDEDNLFLIQATSPLLEPYHIDEMYEKMVKDKANSSLSCVEFKRFFWSKDGVSLNYDYRERPRRQDFEGCMLENGACYINSVYNIKNDKNLLSEPISIYEMPEYTSIELDEEHDYYIIEKLIEKYKFLREEKRREEKRREEKRREEIKVISLFI